MAVIRFASIYNEIYACHSTTFSGEMITLDENGHPLIEFNPDQDGVSKCSGLLLGQSVGEVIIWQHTQTPAEKYARWRQLKIMNADPDEFAAIRRSCLTRWAKEFLFICERANPRTVCRNLVEKWSLQDCRGSIESLTRLGMRVPLPLRNAVRILEKNERSKIANGAH